MENKNEYESRVASLKSSINKSYRELAALYLEINSDESISSVDKEYLLSLVDSFYPSREVTQRLVPYISKRHLGASYQNSIVDLIRFKSGLKKCGLNIAPGGNDKGADRKFAQLLNVSVPLRYKERVPFDELALINGTIVKPYSGSSSRNVFFIEDNKISEVLNRKSYESLEELKSAKVNDKTFETSKWIQEEFVYNNNQGANDLKIYCFYGQVGLILEVDRFSASKPLYCYYDADGNYVDVGRKRVASFEGSGVLQSVMDDAKRISLEFPVPFIRVDFLKGDDAAFLGEITPHPGWHAGERTDFWDYELGKIFDEAWARLFADLLRGKKFDNYFSVYKK